ncbi:hypothetical protein Taro_029370 [Colocasia esculenta]|uniref:Retrotransposon gag domain-containing protein n=1 Tax=Colocasia esculenta TaxID=4460 RepID=A0A843VT29_COLES|nr:hypothetical protein [Colocasia esculenta]
MSGSHPPVPGSRTENLEVLALTELVYQLREDICRMDHRLGEGLAGLEERVTESGVVHEPRHEQFVERPQPQCTHSPVFPPPRAARVGDRQGQLGDCDRESFDEEVGETPRVPVAPRHRGYGHRPDPEFEDERWAYRERDQDIRNARIEAPSFDGSLEPQNYLDWEAWMNCYFEWMGMSDPLRTFFAKTMLRGRALTFWTNLEDRLAQRYEEPINTWNEMKSRLREKYVPTMYRYRLIDRWQNVSQGSRTVSAYIDEFDDLLLRCGAHKEGALTLSQFRKGLRRVY